MGLARIPLCSQRVLLAAALACSALLGGCALPRMIDSEVESFAATAPPSSARYRFERLPSQEQRTGQDRLEAMTEHALAGRGLQRGDATAPYTVQVRLDISQIPNPHWPQPHGPLLLGWRERTRDDGFLLRLEPPWIRHSVQLVLREAAGARVVYETRASFDGPWGDTERLLPAILQGALSGYPQPPAGRRKVVVELPPDGLSAP